jgi:anti-sigma factor RsiW
MPDCQHIDQLVTPYVDRELPEADRRLVDEHLRLCAPCHSRVAAEEVMRHLLRTGQPVLHKTVAPPSLHAKCAEIAAGLKTRGGLAAVTVAASGKEGQAYTPVRQTAHRSWTARLAPLAMAASLVTVVGGAFLYQATERSARVMAAELAADHVKCFAMNAALGTREIPSSVESTMLSSFDWPMHLPSDPSRAGLELVGARPCLYGEGKIAHIMYRHEGRPVSLFMLPNTERAEGFVKVFGHQAAIWCVKNRTFVLVSREPRGDVERLASFVQSSLR